MKEMVIDALDRAILGALLEDARLSQVELAERIPLSATAIARRIRALEERGIIQGYQARISREALGLSMTVIVQIGLKSQNEVLLKAFEEAVMSAPSVVSCHLMSGEDDYLVTVMARDLADFERIHKEQLSRLPGVARLKSSFALRPDANAARAFLIAAPQDFLPDPGIARFNSTAKCDTLLLRHLRGRRTRGSTERPVGSLPCRARLCSPLSRKPWLVLSTNKVWSHRTRPR
jgi:Lrp/AsnC family leucine-responsive transcriptional regulator